jgi:hypothetical protein
MPFLRAGQSIKVIERTVTGQDAYGNDVYGEAIRVIRNCAISPGNSSEDIQGTASVSSDVILHVPTSTDVGNFDRVVLPDGNTYRITGVPKYWHSPFTGSTSMIEIPLQFVSGALQSFPGKGTP